MSRLDEHLDHIRDEVVPTRRATRDALTAEYISDLEARAQPPLLVRGLEQWNAGRYYAQHETLEWLWRATDEPVRDLFKGIIQSGVGAYHVLNENRHGALAKWTGALEYLDPFAGTRPYGIDVAGLRDLIVSARTALLADDGDAPAWEAHRARAEGLEIGWSRSEAAPEVTYALRRLDRAWDEGSVGLARHLEDVTEDEALYRADDASRTIAYLVEHVGIALALTHDFASGDGTLRPPDLEPPTGWPAVRRWLDEQFEHVREYFGLLDDEEYHAPARFFGRPVDRRFVLDAAIEHLLFHAGEVSLARERRRNASP